MVILGNLLDTVRNILNAIKTYINDFNDYVSFQKSSKQSLIAEADISYSNTTTTATTYQIFNNDINIDENGDLIIQIALNTSTTVKLSINGSENYINAGNALNANSWYDFIVAVQGNDSVNLIIDVPASTTITGKVRLIHRRV